MTKPVTCRSELARKLNAYAQKLRVPMTEVACGSKRSLSDDERSCLEEALIASDALKAEIGDTAFSDFERRWEETSMKDDTSSPSVVLTLINVGVHLF